MYTAHTTERDRESEQIDLTIVIWIFPLQHDIEIFLNYRVV